LAKSSSEPEKGGCSENSIPKFVSSTDFNGDMIDGKWSAGTTFSGSCQEGSHNNMNKAKTKFTCTCNADGCAFTPAKEAWMCIDQSVCPLPYWSGNKFSYVKAVTDDWALLKTRFKPDPEYESDKFWKTADFTGVVVCDRDLGMDGVTSLELKTRSMSSDGKAWTVINRPGFHITNREKGMYSKLMIDSPDEPFPWKAGVKEQVTCWVGVVPGHFPNLAKCLGELYLDNGLTCGSKCF